MLTRLLQVFADKEVILSGGAINSPQLLLLSGVGNADELRKHDIPVTQHLPGDLISFFVPSKISPLHRLHIMLRMRVDKMGISGQLTFTFKVGMN